MRTLHILIVEDEPLIAMDLEMMVTEIVTAAVVVEASVAATKKLLHEALDFAFLDVDVTNGKTFETDSRTQACAVCFYFGFAARTAAFRPARRAFHSQAFSPGSD